VQTCGVVLAAWVAVGAAPPVPKPTLGSGTIYVGAYSKHILAIDEATEKIGKIPLKTGFPINVRASTDGTRLYALNSDFERFEVVDTATRQSVDTFTLSGPGKKVRVMGFAIEPRQRFMAIATRTVTKLGDRFQIEPATLLIYDMGQHKVLRSAPWSGDDDFRFYMDLQFSPDGGLLYVFLNEIRILNTESLAQVDQWDLSRPIESGLGGGRLGAADADNDEPGYFTALFTMEDPVQNRRLLGIGRVDLARRSIDYFPLGPTPGADIRLKFALAPDRAHAYIIHEELGNHQFWVVDLREHRVLRKVPFEGRPRMAIRTSSNGKVIYIYEAGPTIDLYDAADFKYLRTITLDSDMTYGSFHVMPPRPQRLPPATPQP
jgi:DNA-binding beta-propeller fold protein YncE